MKHPRLFEGRAKQGSPRIRGCRPAGSNRASSSRRPDATGSTDGPEFTASQLCFC
jgi:hypothetical protein